MNRMKKNFRVYGVILAAGVFASSGVVQAAGITNGAMNRAQIENIMQMPDLVQALNFAQTQSGDGLFDYCDEDVREFAKNFDKNEVFSLAYRRDGETRIDVSTSDPDEIQAFFDAMSAIKVKKITTERSTDSDDIFYFTFADASAYRIAFNGHHLETNGICYEISGDSELWKLADALLQNGEDDTDEMDSLENSNSSGNNLGRDGNLGVTNVGNVGTENLNSGTNKNPGIGIIGNINGNGNNENKNTENETDNANTNSNTDSNADGSYMLTSIIDQDTNATVARCYAPSDYTIEHQLSWWGSGKWQSPSSPVQVNIQAASSDLMYQMAYMSEVAYVYDEMYAQQGLYEEGALFYNTYPQLTTMYASGYADFIISSLITDTDITIEAEEEVTQEQEAKLNDLAQQIYDEQLAAAQAGGQVTVDGVACTSADRTYSFLLDGIEYRAKVVTMTNIVQFSTTASAGYSDTYCVWTAPYTYVYMAPTAAFEKGLDNFDLFLLNTKVSDGFTIAASNLSIQLIAQITNGTQSAQSPDDYFKSEMERQPETYDAESFCDYILSQNAYETADGSTIKLPNTYDYVYEGDDGKIYAGNTADQPAGSTRLYAK